MKSYICIMSVLFSLNQSAFAIDPPCNPSTNKMCLKFSGVSLAPGVQIKEPAGYFTSARGVQKGWLVAQSTGTWRIRIMEYKELTPAEVQAAHPHFHQVGLSNLTVAGNVQYVEYPVNETFGFFQHQIECEDDCANKAFDYYILVP